MESKSHRSILTNEWTKILHCVDFTFNFNVVHLQYFGDGLFLFIPVLDHEFTKYDFPYWHTLSLSDPTKLSFEIVLYGIQILKVSVPW